MKFNFIKVLRAPRVPFFLGLALCVAGCGDAGQSGGGGGRPRFAVMYEVYDSSGSNSYLSLLETLDIPEVSTATATEYAGGRAFVQAYRGDLYIGLPETPTVIRYRVRDDGSLLELGQVSFANYGFDGGQFDDWNVTFLEPHKAYLMNFADGTTVIWDPTEMTILGEIPPPEGVVVRDGWAIEGSPAAVRDGRLYRTFNWANYATAEYSTDVLLAVYDLGTDEVLSVTTETRCSSLGNLVHQDEAGTIYFSNWIWPVAGAIMRNDETPCALRVNAGEQVFDPSYTLDYGALAGGRHGGMFSYLGDQQALVSIFYEENTTFDESTSPWSYVGSLNWRIWSVDLRTGTGAPLEGIGFNGGAYTPMRTDEGLVLLVPGGSEEGYATQVYEVLDGTVTPRVKLPGWSYQIVELD